MAKSPEQNEMCCPFMGMIPLVENTPQLAGIRVQPQVQLKYFPCKPSICRFWHTSFKRCMFDLLFEKNGIAENAKAQDGKDG